jgi:hypothetical protein
VTTAQATASSIAAAQRPDCISCLRPYGRRRKQQLDGEPLVLCDQCWRLAGGAAAIERKLAAGDGQPLVVLDPAAEALIAGGVEYDNLHPLDRVLVEAGVRWTVLRHVIPAARIDLAVEIASRTPPEQTKPTECGDLWLGAVEARIRLRTGAEFRYNCKRRRYWHIARVYRVCMDRIGRPLTWISQKEIAAAVGCSVKTVQRCEQWLQREGLLWEVVPGRQLPRCAVPEGERPAERAERERQMAAAIAAENAARDRARAELAGLHATARDSAGGAPPAAGGRPPGDVPTVGAQPAAERTPAKLPAADEPDGEPERPLVHIVPVYELRVPWTAAEQAEADATVRALTPDRCAGELVAYEHRARQVHPLNATLYRTVIAVGHDGAQVRLDSSKAREALTSESAVALLRLDKNVCPPEVGSVNQLQSSCDRHVDKGRAPRGSDTEPGPDFAPDVPVERRTAPGEGDSRSSRRSRAARAAEWLLRSRLDPRLCEGVSMRYLASLIRGSHLIDRHEWTPEDIADLLHGVGEYAHLPRYVHDPRAWMRARFSRAEPALPPRRLQLVERLERRSRLFGERRRRGDHEPSSRPDFGRRAVAIAGCSMCDELGWLHVADGTPTVRCSHDPDTGGW